MACIFPVFAFGYPRDQLLAQGATRKDVDLVFLLNSYPSKGAKPQKNNPKTYRYIEDFPLLRVIGCPGYLATACHCKISGFRCSEWTWDQWPLLSPAYCSSGNQQMNDNEQAFKESPSTFTSKHA